MKVLDLFCGAGGCSVGYHRAGFEVVGVDKYPQPHYPFKFHLDDAISFAAIHGKEFDLIHASPPCQVYSKTYSLSNKRHVGLIPEVREVLKKLGKPYVIENVVGAPLNNPLLLCGTMFGLRVIRHRLFECRPTLWFPPCCCNHYGRTTATIGKRLRKRGITRTVSLLDGAEFVCVVGCDYLKDEGSLAMGIDWMTKKELSQAIPPPYTEFVGRKMLEELVGKKPLDKFHGQAYL